jgi:hypothetical protein
MAIRIPVVISQHERRSGSVADYEEQLITRIVMESGLDATLIADLKSIQLDTTDHLCIEGLKGDFALATWESSQYVCDHLHRLGIPSLEIVPVDGGPVSRSGDTRVPPKKIFMVGLAASTSIEFTIKTLKDLLVSRSTPVFAIGAPIHRNKPTQPSTGAPIPSATSTAHAPKLTPLNVPKSVMSDLPISIRVDSAQPITPKPVTSSDDSDFPNIDQLMDELDQFEM